MTKSSKRLTRRDAMKVAAAALGAAALSNLPSQWSKPELAAGVLPAHAQTSVSPLVLTTPAPPLFLPSGSPCWDGQPVRFFAAVDPATAGIELQYTLSYVGAPSGTITSPASLTGTLTTDVNGEVSIDVTVTPDSPLFGTIGVLSVVWSFVDPANGTDTITQSVPIEITC